MAGEAVWLGLAESELLQVTMKIPKIEYEDGQFSSYIFAWKTLSNACSPLPNDSCSNTADKGNGHQWKELWPCSLNTF